MWTTSGLPISPFIDQFIDIAWREKYSFVLILVARPADQPSIYENLCRDWSSIDDLTGENIMFLFVGPEAERAMSQAGFLANDKDKQKLFFSPYVAATTNTRRQTSFDLESLNNGYPLAKLAGNVQSVAALRTITESHASQIRELRQRFGLREADLPSLILLARKPTGIQTVAIHGITSLYPLLQSVIDEIEKISTLEGELRQPNNKTDAVSRMAANYVKAMATLQSSGPLSQSPLLELQGILSQESPWDSKLKAAQLHESLLKIKSDEQCSWFYRAHRGSVQAISDWLKSGGDFTQLTSKLSTRIPMDEIAPRRETLLARAVERYRIAKAHVTSPALVDIVIITVNEHETRAVLEAFSGAVGAKPIPEPRDGQLYHRLGVINGTTVYHAVSEMGSGGPGAMQQTVDKAIRSVKPSSVIAVGIAFGVNENKQSIGDILISRQLQLYDLQRTGDKLILRGDKPHAASRLVNHFGTFAQTGWHGTAVRLGLILSGEKLVDNKDYRDQLLSLQVEAIGGEMEGSGLYVSSNDHKVDWIVIKAICDWADGEKNLNKEERQKLAATNAANFVIESLRYATLSPVANQPITQS